MCYSASHFLGVGGTTWFRYLDHLEVKQLTACQKYLGNQWQKYQNSNHDSRFAVLSLGSNDVDLLLHSIKSKLNKLLKSQGPHSINFESLLRHKYNELTAQILHVLYELMMKFQSCKFLYIQITPCPWWGPLARKLAKWLDYFVNYVTHRIGEFWPKELFVNCFHVHLGLAHFGMLASDVVHFRVHRNRPLTLAIMWSLLHMWASANPPFK